MAYSDWNTKVEVLQYAPWYAVQKLFPAIHQVSIINFSAVEARSQALTIIANLDSKSPFSVADRFPQQAYVCEAIGDWSGKFITLRAALSYRPQDKDPKKIKDAKGPEQQQSVEEGKKHKEWNEDDAHQAYNKSIQAMMSELYRLDNVFDRDSFETHFGITWTRTTSLGKPPPMSTENTLLDIVNMSRKLRRREALVSLTGKKGKALRDTLRKLGVGADEGKTELSGGEEEEEEEEEEEQQGGTQVSSELAETAKIPLDLLTIYQQEKRSGFRNLNDQQKWVYIHNCAKAGARPKKILIGEDQFEEGKLVEDQQTYNDVSRIVNWVIRKAKLRKQNKQEAVYLPARYTISENFGFDFSVSDEEKSIFDMLDASKDIEVFDNLLYVLAVGLAHYNPPVTSASSRSGETV